MPEYFLGQYSEVYVSSSRPQLSFVSVLKVEAPPHTVQVWLASSMLPPVSSRAACLLLFILCIKCLQCAWGCTRHKYKGSPCPVGLTVWKAETSNSLGVGTGCCSEIMHYCFRNRLILGSKSMDLGNGQGWRWGNRGLNNRWHVGDRM